MMAAPTAQEITIAITVYDRESYIFQAIQSALDQSIKVQVMIVEDHGPNDSLQKNIRDYFGESISYHRNPRRRGLFGCWNECLEQCTTEWISILHDDDYLYPHFLEEILKTSKECPGKCIYFSSHDIVDSEGRMLLKQPEPKGALWRTISSEYMATHMDTLFPGQLFHVETARMLGGFMETSLYCGDWDMWHKLTCCCGAVQSLKPLAVSRSHESPLRGTSRVIRNGKKRGLEFVQMKRNINRLDQKNKQYIFSRTTVLESAPLALKETLPWLTQLSPYMQKYLMGLFLRSAPPNYIYKMIQKSVRFTGFRGWVLWGSLYKVWFISRIFFRKKRL